MCVERLGADNLQSAVKTFLQKRGTRNADHATPPEATLLFQTQCNINDRTHPRWRSRSSPVLMGNEPDSRQPPPCTWPLQIRGVCRLRFITNIFTRKPPPRFTLWLPSHPLAFVNRSYLHLEVCAGGDASSRGQPSGGVIKPLRTKPVRTKWTI